MSRETIIRDISSYISQTIWRIKII